MNHTLDQSETVFTTHLVDNDFHPIDQIILENKNSAYYDIALFHQEFGVKTKYRHAQKLVYEVDADKSYGMWEIAIALVKKLDMPYLRVFTQGIVYPKAPGKIYLVIENGLFA